MSDQPFYAPNRKIPLPQPRIGEPLWTVEGAGKDGGPVNLTLIEEFYSGPSKTGLDPTPGGPLAGSRGVRRRHTGSGPLCALR